MYHRHFNQGSVLISLISLIVRPNHSCQPWIKGCLIGKVPFKYQIMTIGGITLVNKVY